jgi:predicted LPLAT superfamily acyltransferase
MEYQLTYIIAYETAGETRVSGRRSVRADSGDHALQRFDAEWARYGDQLPYRWIESAHKVG